MPSPSGLHFATLRRRAAIQTTLSTSKPAPEARIPSAVSPIAPIVQLGLSALPLQRQQSTRVAVALRENSQMKQALPSVQHALSDTCLLPERLTATPFQRVSHRRSQVLSPPNSLSSLLAHNLRRNQGTDHLGSRVQLRLNSPRPCRVDSRRNSHLFLQLPPRQTNLQRIHLLSRRFGRACNRACNQAYNRARNQARSRACNRR